MRSLVSALKANHGLTNLLHRGRAYSRLGVPATVTALLLTAACALVAQPDVSLPRFDVASIRLHTEPGRAGSLQPRPNGLIATNVTIEQCIEWAWNLKSYQVIFSSIRSRNEDVRYEITAKAEQPVQIDLLRLMLRSLLADRFSLVSHSERRELPVFSMMLSKSGPLRLGTPNAEEPTRVELDKVQPAEGQRWLFHNSPLASLAGLLSNGLSRPLINSTGLSGNFDFVFILPRWDAATGSLEDHALSEVFPELQRQLGIRVTGNTAPIDVIVVDSVARPQEN